MMVTALSLRVKINTGSSDKAEEASPAPGKRPESVA